MGRRGSSQGESETKAGGAEEDAGCISHCVLQTQGADNWSPGAGWEEVKEAGRREDYRSTRNNKEEENGVGKKLSGALKVKRVNFKRIP